MSILDDGTIKFNCDMCFTNMQQCPYTGEQMSIVPNDDFYNAWTGSDFIPFFMRRARQTLNGLYGDITKDVPIEAYRMCW